jgi:hypothetical protein
MRPLLADADAVAAAAATITEPAANWTPNTAAGFAALAGRCIRTAGADRPGTSELARDLDRLASETMPRPVESVEGANAEGEPEGAGGGFGAECIMCLDAPRQTRLRPCFHAALCEGCAEQVCSAGHCQVTVRVS